MASVRGTAARMPPLVVIYRVCPTHIHKWDANDTAKMARKRRD